ncbi:MAG: hypothetical protein U0527_05115 [Candidatus Eisenbacteria bacterium]
MTRDLVAEHEVAWADPTRPEDREAFCRDTVEALRARLTETEPDLFALTHEESVRLESEIAALSHPAAHLEDEARLWRALLRDERDPLSSLSMVTRLGSDLSLKLASGSLRAASALIEVLGELEARGESKPPELADAVRRTRSLELDPAPARRSFVSSTPPAAAHSKSFPISPACFPGPRSRASARSWGSSKRPMRAIA